MPEIDVIKVAPEPDEMLFHPYCTITLTQCARDENGRILLTPQLINPTEIDFWADDLIEQVNRARVLAKRHVTTARGSLGRV